MATLFVHVSSRLPAVQNEILEIRSLAVLVTTGTMQFCFQLDVQMFENNRSSWWPATVSTKVLFFVNWQLCIYPKLMVSAKMIDIQTSPTSWWADSIHHFACFHRKYFVEVLIIFFREMMCHEVHYFDFTVPCPSDFCQRPWDTPFGKTKCHVYSPSCDNVDHSTECSTFRCSTFLNHLEFSGWTESNVAQRTLKCRDVPILQTSTRINPCSFTPFFLSSTPNTRHQTYQPSGQRPLKTPGILHFFAQKPGLGTELLLALVKRSTVLPLLTLNWKFVGCWSLSLWIQDLVPFHISYHFM